MKKSSLLILTTTLLGSASVFADGDGLKGSLRSCDSQSAVCAADVVLDKLAQQDDRGTIVLAGAAIAARDSVAAADIKK